MEILVPVVQEVDVLIIGAILAGCDLAVRLRKAGRRVIVTSSGNTLGDDVIGRLDKDTLLKASQLDDAHGTPAQYQAKLDRMLLEAGAEYLFGAIPLRPLHEAGTHRLAGWIFYSKSGYFAIAAKAVVDATCDGCLPFQMRLQRRSSGLSECVFQWNIIGDCRPPEKSSGATLEVSLEPVGTNGTFAPFCQYRRAFRLRQNDLPGILHADMLLRADAYTEKTIAAAEWAKFHFLNDAWEGLTPSRELPLYHAADTDVTMLLRETIPSVPIAKTFQGIESRINTTDSQLLWKAPVIRPFAQMTKVPFALESLVSEAPDRDVIIVGTGPDGVSAAFTAAEKGLRVLLLVSSDYVAGNIGELAKAGVEIWFHAVVGGILMHQNRVEGVLVIAPDGSSCLVHAPIIIDATGYAAIATFAGASIHYPHEPELITHGAVVAPRTPPNPFGNPEGALGPQNDLLDTTFSHTLAHLRGEQHFVTKSHLVRNDRARIQGELTLLPHDLILQRRFKDTLAVSTVYLPSFQESCHPLLWMEDFSQKPLEAWIPLRAMLPLRIEGMMVLGKGISTHKDVARACNTDDLLHREGVAAGLLAFHAIQSGVSLRKLPLKPIQEELVGKGLLPPEALQTEDTFLAPTASDLAAVFNRPDQARRVIEADFEVKHDVRSATILAFLGDSSGRDVLNRALCQAVTEQDDHAYCTLATAFTTIGGTPKPMLEKLKTLTPEISLALLRVVCIFFQRWPTNAAVPKLRELRDALQPPNIHHANKLSEAVHTAMQGFYLNTLKSLYLSVALHACDPRDEDTIEFLENAKHSWLLLVARMAHDVERL